MTGPRATPGRGAVSSAAYAVGTAAAVALILWQVALVGRGLSLSDESFVLRLVDSPDSARAAGEIFLFPFLVGPLFELLGHDVALLRLVSLLVVVGTSGLLTRESLALVARSRGDLGRMRSSAAVATVAASATLSLWLGDVRVLGYRTVTVVGLALAAMGVARLLRGHSALGGILVGVGGWTAFVGRPTSAAGLAVLVAAVVTWARLWSRTAVALAALGAGAAALLTLVVARMTPAEAASFLARGAEQNRVLGGHGSTARLVGISEVHVEGLLVVGPLIAVPVLIGLWLRSRVGDRTRPAVDLAVVVVVLVVAAVAGVAVGRFFAPRGFEGQILPVALIVPLTALAVLLERRVRGGAEPMGRPLRAYLVVLLVLPYVSALGSNVYFTWVMAYAAVFWTSALVVVAVRPAPSRRESSPHPSVLMTVSTAAVAVITLVAFVGGPNGPELTRASVPTQVAGGRLLLSPADAGTARGLAELRPRYGITHETPVVDLTGDPVSYALLVGGRFLGRAHFYGYLPGSEDAARWALARQTCEDRAAAWLLYAPDNLTDISGAVTSSGLDLSTDYEEVAAFWPHQSRSPSPVHVLRPLPTVAERLGCGMRS